MNGKLYSVWLDGQPCPVLSAYSDDNEAISAFQSLISILKDDISDGKLEADTLSKMSLYVHGRYLSDGSVRGFSSPQFLISADDVLSFFVSEEVTE